RCLAAGGRRGDLRSDGRAHLRRRPGGRPGPLPRQRRADRDRRARRLGGRGDGGGARGAAAPAEAVMKWLLLIVLASTAACKAGEGTGTAQGSLFMLNCKGYGNDEGTIANPKMFDLKPSFFAAEPIEEGDKYFKVNRLIIRMQPTGRSRELNDALTFDVPDSLQVAR